MSATSPASPATFTRRGALALAGAAALTAGMWTLAGCSNGDEQESSDAGDVAAVPDVSSERADTLTMAISVDPDGLDPQITAAAATFEITNNLYDPLLKVSVDNEIVPGLAESWDISDDGLQITFHLREGLVFSNGDPCDAAAVVSSFERLLSGVSVRAAEYAGYTFEAADDTTVIVTASELNVAMLTDFAYGWTAIVDTRVADSLANAPVGTGPYVLDSWMPQRSLTLTANPAYWGDAPLTEKIVLRVLPDATSQSASLRAGEIDLFQASSEQVAPFVDDPAYQVMEFVMNGVQLMAMNCSNTALADERVRQAIVSAVDKEALIEAVWWGYGEPIGSHYPPVLDGYVDCNDVWPYDPEAAADLLDAAGYAGGLTLRMRLPESYPEYVSAGQVIADALKKVGITCTLDIVDWGLWLSDIYGGAHDYDLTVVGHTGRLDPSVLLGRYTSDSSENYFNYANDEVDALIANYRTELDEEVRRGYVEDLQRILAYDAPALYIQTPVMVYISNDHVHGFALYPIDVFEFKDVWVDTTS